MRSKLVVSFCFVGILLISSVTFAQEDSDPRLWGVWRLVKAGEYEISEFDFDQFQTFTPNGAWGMHYIEGIFYGGWSTQNGFITIDGTGEYAETVHLDLRYSYKFVSGRLVLQESSNGVVEEYQRITEFTGFGFIHCPASVESNMFVGSFGHVTYTDGTPSRLRQSPSLSAQVVDQLPEGAGFVVVGDPVCSDGYTWWPVNTEPYNPGSGRDNNVLSGWIAEGEDGVAYIEPIGWIDTALLRSNVSSEAEVMSDLAQETGSTVYDPGTYPYRQQIVDALLAEIQSPGFYENVVEFVDTAIIVVKNGSGPDPVDIACMFVSADDFWNQDLFGKGNVMGCAVLDATSHVGTYGVAGAFFYVAKLLATPSQLIDPIIVDPVNSWADSRPLTRFYCWLNPEICEGF